MNKNSVKFGLASACLTSAILFGVHTVEASDQSSNIQQNESDSYGKALTTYKAETIKYELDKKAYEAELKAYNESVAKYEADKAEYDKAKAEYDKALATNKETLTKYESDLSEYNKQKAEADKVKAEYEKLKAEWDAKKATYNTKLVEYNKQVKSNEAADKIENDKRRAEYNEKLKKFEEESKKPGRFASKEKNYLIFVKEPNAKISIEVKDTGDTGALAMLKYTQKDGSFWKLNHKKLSSDQLSDEALAKNNLTDKIIKRWDETVTGYREYGKDPHITTYPVIAKKDRPFTVTYTNLENTTYDKKKVTRIDYEYTVLETGSSVDTMQISPAYDPTISVSIYGDFRKHGYSTRVRMKPTLYLEDGTKVIPTKEKPVMFAVSSMNTGWHGYSDNSYYFADNKDMFKEFYGKSGVYDEYLNDEFKKLYNVDLETASKPGGLLSDPSKRQEWNTKKAELKTAYVKDEEEYKKDGFKKVKDYMTNKYGSNVNTWPSTYREIVYAIHNASFIKLNESFVYKHDDGFYADKTLDEINSGNPVWDNQESPYKYKGAGVIKVTEDGFYLEFGATVPFTQLFGINTAIVDEYIDVKPKLELVETPKPTPPTKPVEPKQPELKEPTPLGVAPKEPNKFDKEKPVKPDLKEPKAPTPPVKPDLKEPTPPTRPVEPPKVEKPVKPVEPPKVEKPVKPVEPPKVEKPTEPVEPPKMVKPTKQVETPKEEIPKEETPTKLVEPPKEEKPTLPRTGSASDMSMTVVGLLTTLASFFVFTKRKDESNK
ncbi:LPXTG cell wall anchor domain-containing protein [Streptococcus pneumoniae]|uniref:Streptococcal surface protein B n=1 Tax=Streptococcus pneumoniae TaxID=1313 RepID=A0A9P1QET6_STREE|nr:GbpC/Spa domain-containing protein [Streptococcus pneumoniae]CEO61948.1 streptococcal surface protein B [Streptococcus pneumoniae]CEO64882.1 streptococcal surface protein B [Streptococcus pneumoniae]CEV55132.1 streptococcal surface protein B [Streptococcus pneumoniae]CEV58959.1 streptococcal surface protein B [Streptococcus pneumoniae]CEX07372.1 streptococcal surface protein B [Streptococcus pneumoniae]